MEASEKAPIDIPAGWIRICKSSQCGLHKQALGKRGKHRQEERQPRGGKAEGGSKEGEV